VNLRRKNKNRSNRGRSGRGAAGSGRERGAHLFLGKGRWLNFQERRYEERTAELHQPPRIGEREKESRHVRGSRGEPAR